LQDLASVSPFESEAEAYIQRAIERDDPSHSADSSSVQESILAGVPLDATSEAFTPGENGKPKAKRHGQKISTAAQLYTVSEDLEELRYSSDPSSSHFPTIEEEEDEPTGDTDQLLKNAGVLMKLNYKRRAQKDEDDDSSEEGKQTDGSSDNDAVAQEEAGRQGKGSRRAQLLRRAKGSVSSNFHDFEEWLNYKKMGTYSYIKTVLFFMIIPLVSWNQQFVRITSNLTLERFLSHKDWRVSHSVLLGW
jgi:hypothetical protein